MTVRFSLSPLLFCFFPLHVSSDFCSLLGKPASDSPGQVCVKVAAERARRSLLAWFRFKASSPRARAFTDVQQRKLTNLLEHVRQRKQNSKKLISVSAGRSVQTSHVVSKAGTEVPSLSSRRLRPGGQALFQRAFFTSFSGPSLKTAAFKAQEKPARRNSNLFFRRKM